MEIPSFYEFHYGLFLWFNLEIRMILLFEIRCFTRLPSATHRFINQLPFHLAKVILHRWFLSFTASLLGAYKTRNTGCRMRLRNIVKTKRYFVPQTTYVCNEACVSISRSQKERKKSQKFTQDNGLFLFSIYQISSSSRARAQLSNAVRGILCVESETGSFLLIIVFSSVEWRSNTEVPSEHETHDDRNASLTKWPYRESQSNYKTVSNAFPVASH